MAPIVIYMLAEQVAIAMQHDIANTIFRLNTIKSGLQTNIIQLAQMASSLDPNSPEAKSLEARRQHLATLEKKLDADIDYYKHRLEIANNLKKWGEDGANKGISGH